MLFRLFYNALIAGIFVYIDIVVPARTSTGGGSVLIGIAIYGSAFLLLKTILAIYNHLWWFFCGQCCNDMKSNPDRKKLVEEYWGRHRDYWKRHILEADMQ